MEVILATAGYDHTIRFWEAHSGVCYRTLQYADSQVNKIEITPHKYLAAAGNPHVRLYDVNSKSATPLTSFEGHSGNVTALGFQKDGRWMFTGSEDKSVKIWDLRTPSGGCQREYKCDAAVNTVALHPNQAELISGDQDGNIKVWDLTADKCSREVTPDGDTAMRSVSIAPNGTVAVAANNDGSVFVWRLAAEDTSRFDLLEKFTAHKNYILKAAISPDSRSLATTSADKTIRIWDLDTKGLDKDHTYTLNKTLTGHQRWVWDCVFSADSAYLVTASSDQSARLWDLAQGEPIRHYNGHHKAVVCVALKDYA